MTKEAKHKADFRKTSKWKNWRKYLKSKRKVDEITGKPLYKGFQVHHLDMRDDHYEELYEEKFACLNRKTHDVVHFLYRYDNWEDILENLKQLLYRMEEYNTYGDNE